MDPVATLALISNIYGQNMDLVETGNGLKQALGEAQANEAQLKAENLQLKAENAELKAVLDAATSPEVQDEAQPNEDSEISTAEKETAE